MSGNGLDLTVGVEGLKEFSRAVKRLDADAPKGLRMALNSSADLLISKVRPQIPKLTGAAAASLKAASTRTAVRIRVGGAKAPHYPWLDFGGAVGPGKSVKRPFYKEGRYLYPTARQERASFEDALRRAIIDTAQGVGIEVD